MTKFLNSKQFKDSIITLIIGFVLFPVAVFGAELYLEPAEGEYQQGDVFIVEIRIDTEDECINAVAINLSFSQDILEANDFSQGNSILSLWLKPLEINQAEGLVSFSGGIPGGYCGQIPGDLEQSNLLGRIIFHAKKNGRDLFSAKSEARIEFLEGTQVLLNDGLGTSCELTFKGATFNILAEESEDIKDEWLEELEKDKIPPEVFDIKIQQDPLIFEGKYFIIFSTTDKQTGVDYYEAQEKRNQKIENRIWKQAESPYLLEDQELNSIIKVRAVDKAGNERIAEYIPEISKRTWLFWFVILIFVGLGIIGWIVRKYKPVGTSASL